MNLFLPLFIGAPLGCSFVIYLAFRNRDDKADWIANVCMMYLAAASLWSIKSLSAHGVLTCRMGGYAAPVGINLVLDGFSLLLLIIINVVGLLAAIYSVNYMERFTAKAKYYVMFLLMVAGMNGVVLTGDLFNLYVFLEIASIASYVLVGFACGREQFEASFKYMVLGIVASAFILVGISLTYAATGVLSMVHLSHIVAQGGMNDCFMLAGAFFLMGFGLKAALVPFHAWLPDAHPSAPAPISAMLSGVLIKAIGIYCILRIFFNMFAMTPMVPFILMMLGTVSMVVGALLATGQWDYKRLLAYSSISQMGYVMLGAGVGARVIASGGPAPVAALAILGALFHLINHAGFKSLLFLTSGAVEFSTGTRDLRKMEGVSQRMPVTAATATVGSLAIAGVPPFSGFWSKLFIIIACLQAGYNSLAFIAIGVSVVTLAYFLKVQKYAFFGGLKEGLEKIKEVPVLMRFSMIVLAVMCLAMGLLAVSPLREAVLEPAVKVLTKQM